MISPLNHTLNLREEKKYHQLKKLLIGKQFLFVNVIMKGKTDTIGHLFKRVKRSLPVPHSFERLKKICSKHSTICLNGLQIRLKYISILSKYCDICSNSFCICLQTRSVSAENCTIHWTVWHPFYSSVQNEKMHSSFLNSSWNIAIHIYVTKSYDND